MKPHKSLKATIKSNEADKLNYGLSDIIRDFSKMTPSKTDSEFGDGESSGMGLEEIKSKVSKAKLSKKASKRARKKQFKK